jgi:phytoene desaturase
MYAMAKAMEKRFLELGGQIHLNANVEKILTHEKKAVGIVVNGKTIQGDIVLVNADFPYAMEQLLDANDRGKYTPAKIKKMEYSSSSFIMYFGLNKRIKTTVHQIRYAKDFKKNIDDIFEPTLPEDPSFYIYSPSQIDPTVAPVGKEIIYVLVPVPNREKDAFSWDETMTKQYRDKMVKKLKSIPGFEDFESSIEVERVMTPKDWQSQFNLQFAATFGFKPVLLQSNFFRPQAKALKIKGLYFAGTSTHPGAGIPIVMKSAKIVSDTIMKDWSL